MRLLLQDYVKALAYAGDVEQVASAALILQYSYWDVVTLVALTTSNNTVTTSTLSGGKDSIYSLAMNPSGTAVISGSAENVLRVWDPRACHKNMMKLKGHTDNIKSIVVNRDGTQTIRTHTEGVWSLAVNESFSTVYSAGRDKNVWATDLSNTGYSALVCQEVAPILKLCLIDDDSSLWVSTTDSALNKWSVSHLRYHYDAELQTHLQTMNTEPQQHIKGAASIRQCHILNDKRHVITKDSKSNVDIYDVLSARLVENLGPVSLEEEIKKRTQTVFVPNWFTVDLKIGLLTIHLDESDCFAAWRSAKEANLEENIDIKVNYGVLIVQALLDYWPKTHQQQDEEKCEQKRYFDVPPHTPIIFSELSGKTVLRLLAKDAVGHTEGMLLAEYAPAWITDLVVNRKLPAFNKLPFMLQSYSTSLKSPAKRERLAASDMLQVRKVIEHVQLTNDSSKPDADHEDLAAAALDHVEIYCNDQLLDPSMDLRTAKNFVWKQGGDLTLVYKQINR
ncbi:WDR48 [Bugula neritina]|uniref:WDR48 n=1 Tax=Bugula neritina TaxID=10212 RepID=A0A7J7J6L8_BUGNE|nr:WDR48 [Bugula neritina]